MKSFLCAAGIVAALLLPSGVYAQNRYVEPPPVLVSPDLSAPWVLQLRQNQPPPVRARPMQRSAQVHPREPWRSVRQPTTRQPTTRQHTVRRYQAHTVLQQYRGPEGRRPKDYSHFPLDPKFLPQEVAYDGPHGPGTIVIDTKTRYLYLVLEGGRAKRYGVGVGKEGHGWTGTERVTAKREWPDWRPPAEMIARERRKGRILPVHMAGGLANPLGARALYLGSTLYRIHGTNAPWTIGQAVSSGCIRMRNEDVVDLYERVSVGTKVVVI